MKTIHTKLIAAVAAGAAVAAAPALAARPATNLGQGHGQGKQHAPGQLCKDQSRKKAAPGEGRSPFAICVTGAHTVQVALGDATTQQQSDQVDHRAPGRFCKDKSHKKGTGGKGKSEFAVCVTGAARAQQDAEQQQAQTETQPGDDATDTTDES